MIKIANAHGVVFNDPHRAALWHRHLVSRPVGEQRAADSSAGVRPEPGLMPVSSRRSGSCRVCVARAGSSVGTSVRLKSGRSAVRPRPCPRARQVPDLHEGPHRRDGGPRRERGSAAFPGSCPAGANGSRCVAGSASTRCAAVGRGSRRTKRKWRSAACPGRGGRRDLVLETWPGEAQSFIGRPMKLLPGR